MSDQQPPGSSPPGLPATYPTSSGTYTNQGSSDMLSAAYPLYPTSQPEDLYRASVVGGAGAQSLPSMRTFDPPSQHRVMPPGGNQSVSFAGTHSIGHGATHQMHIPPESFPPYYTPNMGMSPTYGMPPDTTASRYNMPADPRYIGHRQGPKKEIKRRTKTGCLTCRKRRIKCDETQPTCNNCKKSKRDCLGYDPMFRQATSPNQPSPSPQSTQGSSSTAPLGLSPSPSSSGPTALHIPYGASSAALPSAYPPTRRQTPPSATSQLSQDSQFTAQLPQGSLRGQPGYDYYPAPDQAFRSAGFGSLVDESYPAAQRNSSEDPYQYRGGPSST